MSVERTSEQVKVQSTVEPLERPMPHDSSEKFATVDYLPPEVDLAFYRNIYDDLKGLNDTELSRHFERFGRNEGRLASPTALRAELFRTLGSEHAILEIGPFTKPAVRGPKVKYFDIMDQERLLERAAKHGMPTTNAPEIDYVSETGDLGIVPDGSFDRVVSSHCIEHQPDLVNHLQQVHRILQAQGRYYLAVPDKRFCFDHFIGESRTEEMIKAHKERRVVHTFKSVYEHCALTTHNDTARHWRGDHADPRRNERRARAEYAIKMYSEANGSYIDVHAWQFTPQSFRRVMSELSDRGYSPFQVERVYDTVYGENEFTAVLASGSI